MKTFLLKLRLLKRCGNSSGVEHNLAKVGVASSNLVSRSIKFCPSGGMVDARDLKSLGSFYRTGSSPVSGTTIWRHGQVVRHEPAKL